MQALFDTWRGTVVTILIVALAYGPLLLEFFANQWKQPHYQYFPFVLGAFGWLLWQRCAQAKRREADGATGDGAVSIGLLLTAWMLLAGAYLAHSVWLAIVSFVMLIASRFIKVARGWQVEYLWGIWILLLLMIPLPLNRDQDLINWLQGKSSRLSSFLLDGAGVSHLMEGNTLVLPEKQFFVDEACSGIVSVLSIIACAVIYGVWRNRPPLHVLLLALAGVAWATLMNVVRITSVAVAFAWGGLDWSHGMPHEVLGLTVFMFTFLGLISTDYLLLAILAPVAKADAETVAAPINYGAGIARMFDALQAWGAPASNSAAEAPANSVRKSELTSQFALGIAPLLAFGALSLSQIALPLAFREKQRPATHSMERGLALNEGTLPADLTGLKRAGFSHSERDREDTFGQYSQSYDYLDAEGNKYIVSCDFPFGPWWHDLTICYRGVGWTMRDGVQVHAAQSVDGNKWNYLEADFEKPDGESALLMYSMFDEYGDGLSGSARSFLNDLIDSLTKQYTVSRTAKQFQIQVLTSGPGAIRDQRRATAARLLLEVREQLRQAITQAVAPPKTQTDDVPIAGGE